MAVEKGVILKRFKGPRRSFGFLDLYILDIEHFKVSAVLLFFTIPLTVPFVKWGWSMFNISQSVIGQCSAPNREVSAWPAWAACSWGSMLLLTARLHELLVHVRCSYMCAGREDSHSALGRTAAACLLPRAGPNAPPPQMRESKVRRRYSEFKWLRDEIARTVQINMPRWGRKAEKKWKEQDL